MYVVTTEIFLHFSLCYETEWHFESAERLADVCALHTDNAICKVVVITKSCSQSRQLF